MNHRGKVGDVYSINSCQRMVGNRDHGKVTCIAFRNDPIADVKEMNELIKVDKSTALFRTRVIDPKDS